MTKIELSYNLNEGDIQKLAENYYENSTKANKSKKWAVISLLLLSLIICYPATLMLDGGLNTYLYLALFSLIISPILALKEHKRDVIKNTNKRLTKENIGLLGEYHTTISEEGVHATLFPNEPKKEKKYSK